MALNLTLLIQGLIAISLWAALIAGLSYYIDRELPLVSKRSALVGAILSLIPLFGIGFLFYLHFTKPRRMVVGS